MFSVLTAKLFAGASAILFIALVAMGLVIHSRDAKIEEQRTELARQEAAINVQNAAINNVRQEAERSRQAYNEAVQNGQRLLSEAQGRVTVVRQTQRNGCPTPRQIMEAGL